VLNEEGNVFGLMPHPEHAVDARLGSTDGALVLGSLVDAARLSPRRPSRRRLQAECGGERGRLAERLGSRRTSCSRSVTGPRRIAPSVVYAMRTSVRPSSVSSSSNNEAKCLSPTRWETRARSTTVARPQGVAVRVGDAVFVVMQRPYGENVQRMGNASVTKV
jgi:Phosphoribosylformylglycinamidine (FGAM) synthase, glutamine amidotransferase domain